MRFSLPLLGLLCLSASGCESGDDDGGGSIDSAGGSDAPAADPDAPLAACDLPSEPITCAEGDDSPCTAECATAYCNHFGGGSSGAAEQTVCTHACTATPDCPDGWTCAVSAGRCRPPG
jgi:hypothetical protein